MHWISLLALASPELNILAFIVTFGNTITDLGHLNILKVYQCLQRTFEEDSSRRERFAALLPPVKPILAKGSYGPLDGETHTAQGFHGRDGLSGITERHPDLNLAHDAPSSFHLTLTDKPGVDVALDLLREHPPRSITYIALGPLTTLAQMVRKDGELVRNKIGRVVCMGGALDVPGNTTPVAEYNFFADPFAVKELLFPSPPSPHRGLPLDRFTLLPLDLTTLHEMPFDTYIAKIDSQFSNTKNPSQSAGKPHITHFTSAFLERTREVMLTFGRDLVELHDIVAVWCAIENPPSETPLPLAEGWDTRKRRFNIERTGELTRGMLVVDRREDISAYAPGANRSKIQAEMDKRAFQHGPWESIADPAPVQIEIASPDNKSPEVDCVTRTPGPEVLLNLMFKRIWGVGQ